MAKDTVRVLVTGAAGCILPDRKCPASGRSALLTSFPIYRPRTISVACKSNNNHRRNNPDFSRHQKGSSSRNRNRHQQNQEHNSETLDDIDPLPSKNGSLLSLSSNQRYSATATPGKREKEIVELFRKVQAQLRERAAIKEEKKIETAQQQGQGERGTVDSLLNLLRKHSVSQGKKSIPQDEEFNLEQPERPDSFEEESNSTFTSSDEIIDPDPVSFSRPVSNFRRRSPVPRVKFQPVFSAEKSLKPEEKKEEPEIVALEEEAIEESSDELSDLSDKDEAEEETVEASADEIAELVSLKLPELRNIAKSRGVKGYSKMKKGELVKLLRGGGDGS